MSILNIYELSSLRWQLRDVCAVPGSPSGWMLGQHKDGIEIQIGNERRFVSNYREAIMFIGGFRAGLTSRGGN